MAERASSDGGLTTNEVVCRLRESLLSRRTTILVASPGSYRGELIRKVADHMGIAVAELFLFGREALDPGLPEMVSADPVESGLRRLLLSIENAGSALPEPDEQLVALPPGWYSAVSEISGGILLLRDLVPPSEPEDDRLERLATLVRERSYAGCELPADVGVVLTTDPTVWPSYRLEGFASTVSAELLPWRGAASTPAELLGVVRQRGAAKREDPLAHVDIARMLSECQ
jgi:hypothetical protein